jgi:hypothetical protein
MPAQDPRLAAATQYESRGYTTGDPSERGGGSVEEWMRITGARACAARQGA